MRPALIIAAIVLLLGGVMIYLRRKADQGQGEAAYLGPPPPPPPAYQRAGDSKAPQSGGAAGVCRKVMNINTAGISAVPDKNAQYVAKGSQVLTEINCGAVGLVESGAKAVGSAAKSVWNAIF